MVKKQIDHCIKHLLQQKDILNQLQKNILVIFNTSAYTFTNKGASMIVNETEAEEFEKNEWILS